MTAQTVFNTAMDLMANRLESGVIDATGTKEYEVRAPGILTELQAELCKDAPIYKTQDVTASDETSGYVKVTFDDNDFYELYQLLDSDLELQTDFKRVGNDLYVPYDFAGTVVYKYIPSAITALANTMTLDNYICSTVLPNGLASKLLATENAGLSNYFGQVYDELKRSIGKKEPAPIGKIKDVYDSKLTY